VHGKGVEQAARLYAARQPVADGHQVKVEARPVFAFGVPYRATEVGLAIGVQLRTTATGLVIALASGRVVAAPWEAPHVAQRPDNGTAELPQCPDGKESGADPVEMDNVGLDIPQDPVEPAGNPADRPEGLRQRRISGQRYSIQSQAQR